MTTDVSHRASPEDDKEGLPHPKKPPLADGSGPGAEPGGKAGPLNHRPMATDAGEGADQAGERKDKESPRAGPAEPMDTGDATTRGVDSERGPPPLQPGCPPRDWGPESRPTELSLEELSISARPPGPPAPAPPAATQAPAPAPGPRPGTHPEEAPSRPSRKRKLLEDTESGKTLLLDAYRVWQQGQKGVACDLGRIERVMSETYMLLKQVGGRGRAPEASGCSSGGAHQAGGWPRAGPRRPGCSSGSAPRSLLVAPSLVPHRRASGHSPPGAEGGRPVNPCRPCGWASSHSQRPRGWASGHSPPGPEGGCPVNPCRPCRWASGHSPPGPAGGRPVVPGHPEVSYSEPQRVHTLLLLSRFSRVRLCAAA